MNTMEATKINLAWFSATYTTRRIVRLIGEQLSPETIAEYDLTQNAVDDEVVIPESELLIVGVPVYAGRVPAKALSGLTRLRGNRTPAIIVAVYGNRNYDDALLELKDIVVARGFRVISAGTFVAQHSIFPQVGYNRPDERDKSAIADFARKSTELLTGLQGKDGGEIVVKGNHPYKTSGKIPLRPHGNHRCNECGMCVKLCPVQAIPSPAPKKTNKALCISCGRCIVVCPQHARHFGGLLYKMAGRKFAKANSIRKEPECFYI